MARRAKRPAATAVIVNSLARLRFCTAFSEIEFREKRDAGFAPAGFAPGTRYPVDALLAPTYWPDTGPVRVCGCGPM